MKKPRLREVERTCPLLGQRCKSRQPDSKSQTLVDVFFQNHLFLVRSWMSPHLLAWQTDWQGVCTSFLCLWFGFLSEGQVEVGGEGQERRTEFHRAAEQTGWAEIQ